MIKIENIKTYGWEAAVRGMRNPMNSWDKSDSGYFCDLGCIHSSKDMCSNCALNGRDEYVIGDNDKVLMNRLRNLGTPDHRKFMRMITVTMDIVAPLYWWKEFDTYKVGTVANSCSTMHKIADKQFSLDDFSHDHLLGGDVDLLFVMVEKLNKARDLYLETKDKKYWWQMIQLLPSSYNQRRTVQLNYEVLANMHKSRWNHKLDEWRHFCEYMVDILPYSELITGDDIHVEEGSSL